mmetsp:Transcript_27869/g.75317  ORF Transcript_27869/g.75317 Transcript_27869/m.75317 type:complete len:297 (+) Transcript_27869:1506-2396(+)
MGAACVCTRMSGRTSAAWAVHVHQDAYVPSTAIHKGPALHGRCVCVHQDVRENQCCISAACHADAQAQQALHSLSQHQVRCKFLLPSPASQFAQALNSTAGKQCSVSACYTVESSGSVPICGAWVPSSPASSSKPGGLMVMRPKRVTSSVGRAWLAARSRICSRALSRSPLCPAACTHASSIAACALLSVASAAAYLGSSGFLNQGCDLMVSMPMRESCLTSNILSNKSLSSGLRRITAAPLFGRSRQEVLICCSQMSYSPAVLLKLSSWVSKGNTPASMTKSSTPAAHTSTFLPS